MILRRVTRNVREQNWTAVGIEFVIVVVGVFIGIQVSNWNEERQETRQQSLIETRLASDFERIQANVDQAVATHERLTAALFVLREAVARGTAEEDEDADIRRALQYGFSYPNSSHRSATFIELLSSGRLDLIPDESLRVALIDYDRRAQQSRFNLEQIRNYMHTDAPNLNRYRELGGLTRDEGGRTVLSPVVGYDLVGMAADDDFRASLDLLIEMQTWVQINLNAERDEVAALLERLGAGPR